MIISTKKSVQFLISYLIQTGIKNIIFCPGSRNLPLIQSLVENPNFNTYTVIDERSAGFIALGMAKESEQPVVLITTSGSAAVNLGPALVEAYYQQIPLIAITADRPKDSINKGENQTIQQVGLFKNFIKEEVEIDEKIDFKGFERLIRKVNISCFGIKNKGPVHINMPFSEPLLDFTEIIGEFRFDLAFKEEYKVPLMSVFSQFLGKKVLIYNTTANTNAEIANIISYGIKKLNWLVVNELTTNLYLHETIQHFDLICQDHSNLTTPQLIITIGEQMISKRARQYFKSIPNLVHLDISSYKRTWDLLAQKSYFIEGKGEIILGKIAEMKLCNPSEYLYQWLQADELATEYSTAFFTKESWKEFSIVQNFIGSLQSPTNVYWGNSSVIRYAHWSIRNEFCLNHANRGVSGIDGVLSAAIGRHLESKDDRSYCILGDVSFLYEMNALQSLYLVKGLIIIVLNNYGGKIFENIHNLGKNKEVITKHNHNFKSICDMYKLEYQTCKNLKEFEGILNSSNYLAGNILIELCLEGDSNSEWDTYFKQYLPS